MSGRIVALCDSMQLTTSSDDRYISHYPARSDVLWKCAHVALWQTPITVEIDQGSLDGAHPILKFDGDDVFEARINGDVSRTGAFSSIVLPFGDGIRFNKPFGWYVGNANGQNLFVAGFLGIYSPE